MAERDESQWFATPVEAQPLAAQIHTGADNDRALLHTRPRRARGQSQQLHAQLEEAEREAERATDLAVAALAEADGLRRALNTRAQIEMAKGILIERHKVSADEAFRMLVVASQRGHRKLADVARALVEKTSRQD